MSKNGFMEKTQIRALDRLNLVYLNEWLMAGSCPYVKVKINNGSWKELGTVLDKCPNEAGWDEVVLPRNWAGKLRIEERKLEITYLHHIRIEYRYLDKKPRYIALLDRKINPLRLSPGSAVEFLAPLASGGETPVLVLNGFFVGVPQLHSLDPPNDKIDNFRLK